MPQTAKEHREKKKTQIKREERIKGSLSFTALSKQKQEIVIIEVKPQERDILQ